VVGDRQLNAPGPLDDIRVYGELFFNHRMIPQSTTVSSSSPTFITGRLDYSIGRVLAGTGGKAQNQRSRRFRSCLIIIEAKIQRAVTLALPQLLVYLACPHQSRVRRSTNSSVYGVASDGYTFVFVTITDDGSVRLSRTFDVLLGDLEKVLQCLRHILETTALMSPNTTPEKTGGYEEVVDDDDDAIDLDDNNHYAKPPPDEGDGAF
jgi:hypothetical protein